MLQKVSDLGFKCAEKDVYKIHIFPINDFKKIFYSYFFWHRTVVVVEYRALSRLTNILENLLENAKTSSDLSEDEIVAICDILKALFNLTCGYEEKDCDEEETSLLVKICKIIQTLIIVKVSNVDRKTSIVS